MRNWGDRDSPISPKPFLITVFRLSFERLLFANVSTGHGTGAQVQRRLTASDNKGLEDPLDDRGLNKKGVVIRGRHLLHLAPIQEAAVRVRAMANALVLAPVLSFSDATAPYSSDVKTRRVRTAPVRSCYFQRVRKLHMSLAEVGILDRPQSPSPSQPNSPKALTHPHPHSYTHPH